MDGGDPPGAADAAPPPPPSRGHAPSLVSSAGTHGRAHPRPRQGPGMRKKWTGSWASRSPAGGYPDSFATAGNSVGSGPFAWMPSPVARAAALSPAPGGSFHSACTGSSAGRPNYLAQALYGCPTVADITAERRSPRSASEPPVGEQPLLGEERERAAAAFIKDGVQLHEASLTPEQMAIVCLNDADGRWELDTGAAERVFDLIDVDHSGQLSLEEIQKAAEDEDGAAAVFLRECDQPILKGLLDPAIVHDAFRVIDVDGNGELDRQEWMGFIRSVAETRLAYLEGKAHLTGQCYWGRTKDGEDDGCCVRRCGCGRGWAQDFWYFVCNNHPLIAIFLVDPDHPLSRYERIAMELVTNAFSFMMSGMHDWDEAEPPDTKEWNAVWNKQVYSILWVTIPGMILFQLLTLLYTCPMQTCWVDESAASREQIRRMHRCHTCGHWTSVLFVAGAVASIYFGVRMYGFDDVDRSLLLTWVRGRAQGYVLFFVITLALQFNPLCAFALGPVQVGQWELERRRVERLIRESCDGEAAAEPSGSEPAAADGVAR